MTRSLMFVLKVPVLTASECFRLEGTLGDHSPTMGRVACHRSGCSKPCMTWRVSFAEIDLWHMMQLFQVITYRLHLKCFITCKSLQFPRDSHQWKMVRDWFDILFHLTGPDHHSEHSVWFLVLMPLLFNSSFIRHLQNISEIIVIL